MASIQSSSESHLPQLLSIADSNSPEFEFWNILRNPNSFPPPNLLSADQLFADGVVLPLHRLHIHFHEPPDDNDNDRVSPQPGPSSSSSVLAPSKRWRDIFKKTTGKKYLNLKPNSGTGSGSGAGSSEDRKRSDKTKKEKAVTGGISAGAELNINIWPFARSRSAGTGGNRTKTAGVIRKVSSAPCSRSNSRGESNSKGRKLPSSPSRGGGVHLGRSSPVLQIRRGGSGRKGSDPNSSISRLGHKNLNNRQNIPTTCGGGGGGGEEKSTAIDGGGAVDGCVRNSNSSQLFNLRNLFSKKVY